MEALADEWTELIQKHKITGGSSVGTHIVKTDIDEVLTLNLKSDALQAMLWHLIDETIEICGEQGSDEIPGFHSIEEIVKTSSSHLCAEIRLPSTSNKRAKISYVVNRYTKHLFVAIAQEALLACYSMGDIDESASSRTALLCIDSIKGNMYIHFPYVAAKTAVAVDTFISTMRMICEKHKLLKKLRYDDQITIDYVVVSIRNHTIPLHLQYEFEAYDCIPINEADSDTKFQIPLERYLDVDGRKDIDNTECIKLVLRRLSFRWHNPELRTFKKRTDKQNKYLSSSKLTKSDIDKSIKRENLADLIGTELIVKEETNEELLKMFVDVLSPERMRNLPYWKIFAQCVCNIMEKSDEGRNILKSYTETLFDDDIYTFKHETIIPLGERKSDPNNVYKDDEYDPDAEPRIIKEGNITQPIMRDFSDRTLALFPITCSDDIDIYWSNLNVTSRPGIATIRHWVSKDSSEWMQSYKAIKLRQYAFSCINITASSVEIARLIEFDRRDMYVIVANGGEPEWYEFKCNHFARMNGTTHLINYMTQECVKYFRVIRDALNVQFKKLNGSTDEDDDENDDTQSIRQREKAMKRLDFGIGRCNKILTDLGSPSPKTNIFKELVPIIHAKTEMFMEHCDESRKTFHYPNGVADLYYDIFRDATPDDWSTKVAGCNFERFPESDKGMKFIRQFQSQLFNEDDVREFDEQNIAQMFEGGDIHKMITCHIGGKHNGKSTRFRAIERSLKDYFKVSDTSIATGGRQQSGSAKPDIVRLRGVRGTSLQEPGPNERFNVGVLKGMIDRLGGRGVYGREIIEYDPQFVMHVILNIMLSIPAEEAAFLDRIYVQYYLNTFSAKAPTDPEQQRAQRHYPANKHLEQLLSHYLSQQMYVWMKAYWRYIDRGMRIPFSVMHANASYAYDIDHFQQFIDRCIDKTNDEDDTITDEAMFNAYREWLHSTHPKELPGNLTQFSSKMSSAEKLGPLDLQTKMWHSIMLRDSGVSSSRGYDGNNNDNSHRVRRRDNIVDDVKNDEGGRTYGRSK